MYIAAAALKHAKKLKGDSEWKHKRNIHLPVARLRMWQLRSKEALMTRGLETPAPHTSAVTGSVCSDLSAHKTR